jgi:His-Xaa-Ser system protein HxsD
VTIKLAKEIYLKEALIKAAYQFTDRCYIHIDTDDGNYLVEISAKEDGEINGIEKEFENELVAQMTRLVVLKQTSNIRKIIMARALASTIIDHDENKNVDVPLFEDQDEMLFNKSIYLKEAISTAINDYAEIAKINLTEHDNYYFCKFLKCEYDADKTGYEFANYVIDIMNGLR